MSMILAATHDKYKVRELGASEVTYITVEGAGGGGEVVDATGAKGIAVLHHLPIFRQIFHFHENPSSSVISGTISRENCFPAKTQKTPENRKTHQHETLPKRDAISLQFP